MGWYIRFIRFLVLQVNPCNLFIFTWYEEGLLYGIRGRIAQL